MIITLANFKMNKTLYDNKVWAEKFCELLFKGRKLSSKVGCAPSFPYIKTMKDVLIGTGIYVGAQNMYFEPKGAFTGEVSISQLKDLGIDFVIIGHSERRHIFGETDELIKKKVHSAASNGILPVLCVGETLEQRKSGKTLEIIEKQLEALEGAKNHIVIAYEPVWAIGTGIPATKEQIKEVVDFIREKSKKYIKDFSVLYGGSIDEKVAEEISDICDGGLVGSASLDPQKFYKICLAFDTV
ncbi:MAG: triose-phosphate isomerase [Candidatus Calescibacterium sp.]|nr:triose-phosphate isomerase [Candidatus Calescibacterium sp.]MDW8087200.1 triose-phosphate isomerase [Candidatus Calescibacterium sp.]